MRIQDIAVNSTLSIPILIGLGLAALGARNLWHAFSSPHWPRVPGVVLQSATSGDSATYSATIVVGYRVGERDYTTDAIHFGQIVGSGDSSDGELRRLRYPPGAKVTVSYNPRDPSIAAVHPGFHSAVLWLPGAGLGFLLPGVMFVMLYQSTFRGGGLGIGLAMFAIIFMMIGVAMLSGGLLSLWRSYSSQSWPVAKGTILYGKQDASTTVTQDEDGTTQRSTSYGTHFVFRYEVDGRVHFSNIRRFGQLSASDEDWAAEIAERYPLGKAIEVAYSPSDPDLAVLEPGVSSEAYWLPGAGAAFLLFGSAVLIWGIPALMGRQFSGR